MSYHYNFLICTEINNIEIPEPVEDEPEEEEEEEESNWDDDENFDDLDSSPTREYIDEIEDDELEDDEEIEPEDEEDDVPAEPSTNELITSLITGKDLADNLPIIVKRAIQNAKSAGLDADAIAKYIAKKIV